MRIVSRLHLRKAQTSLPIRWAGQFLFSAYCLVPVSTAVIEKSGTRDLNWHFACWVKISADDILKYFSNLS